MNCTRLYLIRHGQTDWNAQARLQGQTDIPLNETGRLQAQQAQHFLQSVNFDAVYTSPLQRAVETARLVTNWPENKIRQDARLAEISFGVLEGGITRELGDDFACFFAAPQRYQPPEGGESLAHLMQRTGNFARDVLSLHSGQTVLAASHGAALNALLTQVLCRPLTEFWSSNLGNCSVVILEGCNGAFTLKEIIGAQTGDYISRYLK